MSAITQQIINTLPEGEFGPQFSRYVRLLEHKEKFADKRVLDIACGSGYGSYFIKKYLRANEVMGIDADPEAINYAQKNFYSPGLSFINASSTQFTENTLNLKAFDAIVSYETIEHVTNPEIFFK